MDILFRHEAEEGRRVLQVVKLDKDEFEKIVWRAEHSKVEFVSADRTFRTWKATGEVTVRALEVLVGRTLTDRDTAVFRAIGVLGLPIQRGKRSIFPLTWNSIPVRDLRGMFLRVLRGRHPSLPPDLGNFYFVPPLTLPRSRTYTSTAPTRSVRTQLWVYTKEETAEDFSRAVCEKDCVNDIDRLPSPTHPGG